MKQRKTRNSETAQQYIAHWAGTNIAIGGYAPRQWAILVMEGKKSLEDVPDRYDAIVRKYISIAEMRLSKCCGQP